MTDSATRVYRVTVRGRFQNLDSPARRFLEAEQANHDIFRSAFTAEGTLTYELPAGFFNLRYEVRTGDGDGAAAEDALARAISFLATMKFSHGPLRANVFDTSAVWEPAPSATPRTQVD